MQKNKIITVLITCAIGFSLLAGYLIWHFMSPQRGTIYVFNSNYSSGDQITAKMLTPMQVDASIVVAGRKDWVSSRFVTPSEYADVVRAGDSLRMDVSEGMPLTTAMLSVSGGSTIEMNMKTDAIAVSVPLDRFTGVTNDLKAGARVNVYATDNVATRLIQQNKRVLEVFKNEGNLVGIALEEDVEESMELINAINKGKIYLGLVDATGYQSIEGSDPWYAFDSSKLLDEGNGEPEEDTTYEDYLALYEQEHKNDNEQTVEQNETEGIVQEESGNEVQEAAPSNDEAQVQEEPLF